jgi:hypothetical protein
MSEYGYIPEAPEQSFGNNKGIFTPKDIYDLTRADKYTNYGQLELIETQTVTSVTNIDFTDIKQDIYNVHFMTITASQNDANENVSIRFFEGGVVQSGTYYQWALQNGGSDGTFSESKSTTGTRVIGTRFADSGDPLTSYQYFYNLGDSTKYSFQTMHSVVDHSGVFEMRFGSGVMTRATEVDGIRAYQNTGYQITGTISLYGIRYS